MKFTVKLTVLLLVLILASCQAHVKQAVVGMNDTHRISPAIVAAVIEVESGGNPKARSRTGCIGLGQICPSTARYLGYHPSEMYDPHKNIAAMTEYLNILHEESGGSIVHTLAYYNAGARNYRAGLGYAHKVLRIAGHNIGARALKKTKKSRRVKKSKSPGGIDAGPVKAYGPANYKFD